MIHAHVGNNGEQGSHYVGGIQPTAHAHFHDGKVNLLFGKPEQGQGGSAFKIGDLAAVKDVNNGVDQTSKVLPAYITVVDFKSLAHRTEMRRSVKTGVVACARKDGA